MKCPQCGNVNIRRNGFRDGVQQYHCPSCGRYFRDSSQQESNQEQKLIVKKVMGLSENQLREKHDVRYQVDCATKQLKEGFYLTDGEFVAMAKIKAGQGYRAVIDHPEFEKFRGRAGSVNYWSHPTSIKKLKEEGVMQ